MKELTFNEMKTIKPGEALSITAVMAILVTAIIAVVVFRLFNSTDATVSIPGGFKFDWN